MEVQEEDIYSLPAINESPWLICTHENPKSKLDKQTFFAMKNNNTYVKKIVDLDGKSILGSSHGWLILRERANPTMYSIWNPITHQSILLPELLDLPEEEEHITCITCIFTSAPFEDVCNNVYVSCVLLVFFKGLVFSCRPTRRDDCKWVKQSLEYEGQSVVIQTAASLNGDIYAYAYINDDEYEDGRIKIIFGRIKVSDSDSDGGSNLVVFETFDVECPYSKINTVYPRSRCYLVEVCGELYILFIVPRQSHGMEDYDIFKVFVWRLFRRCWIRVDSLGDRAFLLGGNCCTWCWADASYLGSSCTGIERNCIYVATRESQTIHQYRLQDDRYTLLMSHRNFVWSSDGPIWFMPRNPKAIPICQYIANCSYPLFMSLKNNKDGICELRDPCQNISYTITAPYSPDLLSTIEYCKDGWLLSRIEGRSLECLNPFTQERYKYPSDDTIVGLSSFAFSTCPTSPDCLTVGIWGSSWVEISYFQAGKDKWDYCYFEADLDEDSGFKFQSNYNSSPKYHDEAFYFLDVNGNLGIFKMVEGEWSWKVHKGPIPEDVSLNSCYLAELDGQLISTLIEEFGKSVKVFQFDTLHKDWVELDDLGDYMLFLSPTSSFSVSTKNSSMKNRIYLPKRFNDDMVFYSLDTRGYHTTSNHGFIKDFYGMSSQSFCCWI